MNLPLLLPLLAACAVAYGLARWFTALSRDWALKHGIVSQVTHRSSHTIPTARLGGVGLALGFGVAAFLYLLTRHFSGYPVFESSIILWAASGWFLFFAVGLLDDVYDLPPLVKLGLSIVAVMAPTLGGRLLFNAVTPATGLPAAASFLLNAGITCFWMLFFVNGFNFMDGMDGLAAGFARAAALTMFIAPLVRISFSMPGGGFSVFFLLPLLAAACWGFLHWNNPPAKVFMGDGGSLSLGYLLALYVVLGRMRYNIVLNDGSIRHLEVFLLPVISSLTVLFPFIFDVVLTLIRRARRGENLLKAHREHLYQRLMKTSLSHAEVLKICKRTFWACNGAALLGALTPHPAGRWAAFGVAICVMLAYWRFTLRRERAAGA